MLTTFHRNALDSTLGRWLGPFGVHQVTVPHPPLGKDKGRGYHKDTLIVKKKTTKLYQRKNPTCTQNNPQILPNPPLKCTTKPPNCTPPPPEMYQNTPGGEGGWHVSGRFLVPFMSGGGGWYILRIFEGLSVQRGGGLVFTIVASQVHMVYACYHPTVGYSVCPHLVEKMLRKPAVMQCGSFMSSSCAWDCNPIVFLRDAFSCMLRTWCTQCMHWGCVKKGATTTTTFEKPSTPPRKTLYAKTLQETRCALQNLL